MLFCFFTADYTDFSDWENVANFSQPSTIESMVKLTFVLGAVEVAFRFCNQTAVVDHPKFVAADANALSGTARPGIRSN